MTFFCHFLCIFCIILDIFTVDHGKPLIFSGKLVKKWPKNGQKMVKKWQKIVKNDGFEAKKGGQNAKKPKKRQNRVLPVFPALPGGSGPTFYLEKHPIPHESEKSALKNWQNLALFAFFAILKKGEKSCIFATGTPPRGGPIWGTPPFIWGPPPYGGG